MLEIFRSLWSHAPSLEVPVIRLLEAFYGQPSMIWQQQMYEQEREV